MTERATAAPGTKATVLMVTGPHGNRPAAAPDRWACRRAVDR